MLHTRVCSAVANVKGNGSARYPADGQLSLVFKADVAVYGQVDLEYGSWNTFLVPD